MTEKPSLDGLRIDRSGAEERGGGWKLWLALAIVLLAIGAGVWAWLRIPRAVEVKTATARAVSGGSAAGAVLDASGYVTARRQATVSSKVTGKVTEIHVEEGMKVQAGQVLARLDDSTARRQLSLAEAQTSSARHALQETEVRLKEARLNQKRMRDLLKEGVTTQSQLDAADAETDSFAARLEVLRQDIEVAQRQAELYRQSLDDLVIRAPFTGVAISKDAQPGEMISPVSAGGGFTRTGICTLVDMASLEIEVDVNEAYINRVRNGQRAVAVLDAYPDWQIPAKVITTIPAADRQKATVKVRLAFDQLDPRILPDMGVKVSFLSDEKEMPAAEVKPKVLVPKAAVRGDDQPYVFIVQGDKVERRAIRTAPATGEDVAVVSGLSGGEEVVIEGPEQLADGYKVKVRNES
ncbi:MAG TPA: efflux RND transporter periplasmic adaptor subunit [Thermoanaerobaculia bacterium]|jgi:RND family efflux transporter MFP subunit|nr:efflux RND transporter periplasmic adaptor subunit [Thermoanaerobaculia bacterium]